MRSSNKPGRRTAAAFAAVLAMTCAVPIGAAQAQNNVAIREGVAAVVDDDVITTYDVRQRMAWLVINTGIRPTEENYNTLRQQALSALINESLQRQELEEQERVRELAPGTLFATDADVDDYLQSIASQNGLTTEQFVAEMNARGLSTRTVREQARILISWQQWTRGLYGRLIRISDAEVDAVIRDVEAAAHQPSYLLSEIFVSADSSGSMETAMATANQIIAQLQQQGRFEPLAAQFSALPTAARGGDAGWMTEAEVRPELVDVLRQMRAGQVSRPIQVPGGVYVVHIRDKQTGETTTSVELKQIAVPLSSGAADDLVAGAEARLSEVRGEVNGCANIEQVAATNGLQAGDLGQANVEDLAPAFRDAIEGLDTGDVSQPVRTQIGMHIVAVCNRTTQGSVEVPSRVEVQDRLYNDEIALIQRRELRNLRNAAVIRVPQ